MESLRVSIQEREKHKREYDIKMNDRMMQSKEVKVDSSKALDANLVVTESNGAESEKHDTSSRSRNDTHAELADIKPMNDKESMVKDMSYDHHSSVSSARRFNVSGDMLFIPSLSIKKLNLSRDKGLNQLPQILPEEVSNFASPVIEKMITESLNQVNLAKASSQPQSTYEAAATLIKFELKKILIKKMNSSESYLTALEHQECYDGQKGNQGNDDVEPRKESVSKRDWFTKPSRPQEPTNPDWNEDKTP
nr:hypothetical protein [Tanacetum cinerariifolium]